MPLFFEIKVRVNGEEKWADGRKVFKYLLEDYSKVSYKGKVVEPYPDRVNKFYDELPKDLIDMWSKAYPNVDIKVECERCRVWLLSNTNKAKKDFKNFTNRWLGKACQNGGQIPVVMSEKRLEKQIAKQKKYDQEAMIDSAPQDWVQDFIKGVKTNMGKK